jgi:adenosylhomocysteine nucleosidase
MKRMQIVVQVSTIREWDALLALLPHSSEVQSSPTGSFVTYTWSSFHGPLTGVLLHGGTGKILAAASAQYAALTWRPTYLFLLGTCGAIDPKIRELDVIYATRTIVHDIAIEAKVRELTTDLPGLWTHVVTPYPVHRGLMVSGDLAVTAANVQLVRDRFPALAADWESGAVAKVCALNGIPCAILKGVSDLPEAAVAQQLERYYTNTPRVMERVWQILEQYLAAWSSSEYALE